MRGDQGAAGGAAAQAGGGAGAVAAGGDKAGQAKAAAAEDDAGLLSDEALKRWVWTCGSASHGCRSIPDEEDVGVFGRFRAC